MGIMLGFTKKEKAKTMAFGRTLDLLVIVVAMCRSIEGRISKEKEITTKEAEDLIIECLIDGIKRK